MEGRGDPPWSRSRRARRSRRPRIARLYGWLAEFDHSPVVELNRAVAIAEAEGPAGGLELIERLERYGPLQVARADLLRRLGRVDEARDAYRRAIELSDNRVQRAFLERRMGELGSG